MCIRTLNTFATAVLLVAILLASSRGSAATLLAHYSIEQGSGTTVLDVAGTPQDGTFGTSSSAPAWSNNAAPVPGGSTWSLYFDGGSGSSGDIVNLAPIDDLEIDGSFSVGVWVNVDAIGSANLAPAILGVFQNSSPFEHNYLLRIHNSGHANAGRVGFISRDDSGDTVSLLDPVAVNDPQDGFLDTWVHYAVTFDATTGDTILYRDGVSVATGTMPNAPASFNTNQDNAWLGGQVGGDSFNGLLDDARIYTGVLTPQEVLALTVIPEPKTFSLAAISLAILGMFRWRKRRC